MEPGYYWIKHEGFLFPAHWDGECWKHSASSFPPVEGHTNVISQRILPPPCPTGCNCTTNPDGSVTVHCT